MVKGSATISVPLSVDTYAAPREKAREVENELEGGQTGQGEGRRRQPFLVFEEKRIVSDEEEEEKVCSGRVVYLQW